MKYLQHVLHQWAKTHPMAVDLPFSPDQPHCSRAHAQVAMATGMHPTLRLPGLPPLLRVQCSIRACSSPSPCWGTWPHWGDLIVDGLIGLICYGREGVCSYQNRHWISISNRFWQHHHPQTCTLLTSSAQQPLQMVLLHCALPTTYLQLELERYGEMWRDSRERSRWLSQQLTPRASVWLATVSPKVGFCYFSWSRYLVTRWVLERPNLSPIETRTWAQGEGPWKLFSPLLSPRVPFWVHLHLGPLRGKNEVIKRLASKTYH